MAEPIATIIPGDEWIELVLEKLGIDSALVSRVNIDARPGKPLLIHITHLGTLGVLDVRSPETDECEIVECEIVLAGKGG